MTRRNLGPAITLHGIALGSIVFVAAQAEAAAQFDDEWVGFAQANGLLVADASLGLDDTEEKDYAVGDLDGDGWDDLVVVRKQPHTTPGARVNVLLMNEGGVLVDRTSLYASASTVPGDLGFLTPTNDRDVALADVDGDGLLDVITATTLSDGEPKHISHPRVYLNLGHDPQGQWLGLEYQEHRIPQLLVGGQPCAPRFSAVAAGDVTGDGLPDLYFVHHAAPFGICGDMDDRLLVNDGTGTFVDESSTRMDPAWLASGFGISTQIADMNGDGHADVVKNSGRSGAATSVIYNDPANPGSFLSQQVFYQHAGYQVRVGDLNRDGRIDAVIVDDSNDRFLLNAGNDAQGEVRWSAPHAFEFVFGQDDGFGGQISIADLDLDGWPDVLIADVDIDLSGCNRRLHVYHNRGGVVGGGITLREEAGTSGWRGAVGLTPADLRGTFDVAVVDVDRDGWPDLVLGRCTGTSVWRNTLADQPVGTSYCACDGSGASPPCANPGAAGHGCRNSSGQGAGLTATGSASVLADALLLHAEGMLTGQAALLFAGTSAVNGGNGAPFGDGLRCVGNGVRRLGIRNAGGSGQATWGPGLASQAGWTAGATRRFQAWYRDPVASPCGNGFNLTNGVELTFVP